MDFPVAATELLQQSYWLDWMVTGLGIFVPTNEPVGNFTTLGLPPVHMPTNNAYCSRVPSHGMPQMFNQDLEATTMVITRQALRWLEEHHSVLNDTKLYFETQNSFHPDRTVKMFVTSRVILQVKAHVHLDQF